MDRPARLALIELLDRDGRLLQRADVTAWPLSLGRALDNDVVLDDPHVAPRHVQLLRAEDGTVLLKVGESLNGVKLGKRRLASGESAVLEASRADALDSFQIGSTRVRLRLADQPLVPERLLSHSAAPNWTTAALLLALALLMWWPAWLAADPGREWSEWVPMALGVPAALAAWSLLWALASKLFQHRFDFWGHLGVLVRLLVPLTVLDLVLPQLAASLGWPGLWQLAQWSTPALMALLLWRHALRVVPGRPRLLAAGALVLVAVGSLPGMVKQYKQFERLTNSPYMTTLPLPAWRWHRAGSVDDFIQDAQTLEAALKARVEASRKDNGSDEDEAL